MTYWLLTQSKGHRGKWGKANYLRKDLDLCFTGFCFLPVITTKGKFRISALIFLWTTFHCIYYKLEKFNIEENKIRFGILKIAGQSGPLLVHAAPCDQKIIIFPNNIVFIAQQTRCMCNDDSKPVVLAKDTLGTTLNWWSALPLLQIPRLSKHFTQYAVKRDCFFTAHLQNIKCNP